MTNTTAPTIAELFKTFASFRRHLMKARATCPRPGYHNDLEPSKAAATSAFLKLIPEMIDSLRGQITLYQKAHGEQYFTVALRTLDLMHKKPTLVFDLGAGALHKQLLFPADLLFTVTKERRDPGEKGVN